MTDKYQPGDALFQMAAGRAHSYRISGTREVTTASGGQSTILLWRGTCAVCGHEFECRRRDRSAGT